MTSRKRIIERSNQASVSRVLRTRRKMEPVDSAGDVVEMPDTEVAIALLKKSPVTLNKFRGGEYLHVSDLLGKCMRKIALSEVNDIAMPSQFIHESMALTFAQGVALHDHVKGRIFSGHSDMLYGSWSCRCGNLHTKTSLYRDVKQKRCTLCGEGPTKYHELELRDPDLMIIGSPDITIYLEEYRVYYPIEIKSINYEDWKELSRPKPDHVLQVLFYWYLLKKLGYPVPSQVSILYVTKGFVFKTPYKEFTVIPEAVISRLDEYIEEARMLKSARDGGALPARSVCSSKDCKEAKECHVVNLCFQCK